MPFAALEESDYRDWPLFDEFRQTPEFRASFASMFGSDFDRTLVASVSEVIADIETQEGPLIEGEPSLATLTSDKEKPDDLKSDELRSTQ
jgi:hypothetical protein